MHSALKILLSHSWNNNMWSLKTVLLKIFNLTMQYKIKA